MKFTFEKVQRRQLWQNIPENDWNDWSWQLRYSLKSQTDFEQVFALDNDEKQAFAKMHNLFQIRTTPYYASLAHADMKADPIRKMLMPTGLEFSKGIQSMSDPLGEGKNTPAPRIVHRYPDRVLLLVTDVCSVYCRYCLRKHFTAKDQALASIDEMEQAIAYIRSHPGIREVILSGGDPLTLSDAKLEQILTRVRDIDHVEIIRIGTRMPVVSPMRITDTLTRILRKFAPVFLMAHFNHPRELTFEAAEALTKLVDNGIPVMNQMVLLNGVNNSAAIVQALSRRLLYLRVKPYYMFQCDPSEGTDHLRTSIEDSLSIQRELWGTLSGLAMPTYSIDIPQGGGKTYLTPNFEVANEGATRSFVGWDGVRADYVSPPAENIVKPADSNDYQNEWQQLLNSKLGILRD